MRNIRLLGVGVIFLSACTQTASPAIVTTTSQPSLLAAHTLAPAKTATSRVAAKADVFRGPDSVFFKSIGTLSTADDFSISGKWGEYYQINTETLSGYIQSEMVDPAPSDIPELQPLSIPPYSEKPIDLSAGIRKNNDFHFSEDWFVPVPKHSLLVWDIQLPEDIPNEFEIIILNASPFLSKDLWRTNSIILTIKQDRTMEFSILNGLKATAPNEAVKNSVSLGSAPISGHFLAIFRLWNGAIQKVIIQDAEESNSVLAVLTTVSPGYTFKETNWGTAYVALTGLDEGSMSEGLIISGKAVPNGVNNISKMGETQPPKDTNSLLLNKDGTLLGVLSATGRINLFETISWKRIAEISMDPYMGGMDISASGLLATATKDHSLAIFNILDGTVRTARIGYAANKRDACSARFDLSESLIGMICQDGLIALFRAEDGKDIPFTRPSFYSVFQVSHDLRSINGAVWTSTGMKLFLKTTDDFQTWTTISMAGMDNVIGIGDEGSIFAAINSVHTSIKVFNIINNKVNPSPVLFVPILPVDDKEDEFIRSEAVFGEKNTEMILFMIYTKHVQVSRFRFGESKPYFSQSYATNGYSFIYAVSRSRNAIALRLTEYTIAFTNFSAPATSKEFDLLS